MIDWTGVSVRKDKQQVLLFDETLNIKSQQNRWTCVIYTHVPDCDVYTVF